MLKQGPVWALGAAAGRTLGGVRAALVKTDGVRIEELGETSHRPYCAGELAMLASVLGRWPGDVDADDLEAAQEVVEAAHVALLSKVKEADLIGFPGLTLAHEPQGRGAHQLGDGQILAEVLGRPVAWDYAMADMRLGGEGAPLAAFYHFALAKYLEAQAPLAFVNLGAVASVTWVDPGKSRPEEEGALLAFDAGPGMAQLDDLIAARLGEACDIGGALSAKGTADQEGVAAFLEQGYFYRVPPKSLDRNTFTGLVEAAAPLPDADAAATICAVIVAAIAQGLGHCPTPPERVLVSGGGRRNAALMAGLIEALDCPVLPVEELELDGDALDAQAAAYLAVRVARGLPTSCPTSTGVAAAVGGGVVSTPDAAG
ncbi:MAG: anhydro-N-acetylmuramic acid kinase [Maritimibacter sp.]